jgi:hypothetical protein
VKILRVLLIISLLLALASPSLAQTKPGAPAAKQPDIVDALGKVKLADLKKAVPRGVEAPFKAEPGSRLASVGAVTRFAVPGEEVVYYFNRAGVLVSAQTKARRPIPKEELIKEIKGIEFKKFPPNQVSAAFVRRSATVIQGFYLSKDEKFVEYTTYDYFPGK